MIRCATRERERLWLREKRVEKIATSADPVNIVGAGCQRGRCFKCARGKRRHESASAAGTPRPWTFFGVAAGLLARRSSLSPVFPMRCRISDVRFGNNSLLTVAGAAPDSRAYAQSPTSLLATMPCVMMDRDKLHLVRFEQACQCRWHAARKNLPRSRGSCEQPRIACAMIDRVDVCAALPISDPRRGSSENVFPKLRGKPVRPKKPKPELPPQL
jgi:hypothetical protein